jgi:hypothetical protein
MTDHKRRVGRPATGINSRVVRIPLDMDIHLAQRMYYDWLPTLVRYNQACIDKLSSPRYDALRSLMQELGIDEVTLPDQ